MNDLTGAKGLKVEGIMFNAVKDIYFTSRIKFEKLSNYTVKNICRLTEHFFSETTEHVPCFKLPFIYG
jgi:hypothetical protein